MSTEEREGTVGTPAGARWGAGLEAALVVLSVVFFLLNTIGGAAFKSLTADEATHNLFGRAVLDGRTADLPLPAQGGAAADALGTWLLGRARALASADAQVDALFWARLPTALLGALLVVAMWALARRLGGTWAGVTAAWLAAWCPTLLGHAKWQTADVPTALGMVGGTLAIVAFLERPDARRGALAAAAVGAAQLGKVTMLLLLPAFALLAVLAWLAARRRLETGARRRLAGRFAAGVAGAVLASVVLINSAYAGWRSFRPARECPLRVVAATVGRVPAAAALPVPVAVGYLRTVQAALDDRRSGHWAYFHGRHSRTGFLAYYPVLAAMKATPAELALAALFAWLLATRRLRLARADLAVGLIAAAFVASQMFGVAVQIGIRYMLPAWTLGLVLVARAASAGRRRVLVAVAVLAFAHAYSSGRAFPHHLSYFNALAGGRCSAWRWFNDSNLSWGQDDFYLQEWRSQQREPVLVNPGRPAPGLIAIDANVLVGLDPDQAAHSAWLRENYRPAGCVTPAWIVFRVPDDRRLRDLAAAAYRSTR